MKLILAYLRGVPALKVLLVCGFYQLTMKALGWNDDWLMPLLWREHGWKSRRAHHWWSSASFGDGRAHHWWSSASFGASLTLTLTLTQIFQPSPHFIITEPNKIALGEEKEKSLSPNDSLDHQWCALPSTDSKFASSILHHRMLVNCVSSLLQGEGSSLQSSSRMEVEQQREEEVAVCLLRQGHFQGASTEYV